MSADLEHDRLRPERRRMLDAERSGGAGRRGVGPLARGALAALLAAAVGWAGCSSNGGGAGTTTGAAATTGGSQVIECPGALLCGTACIDAASDPKNCGTCGTACAAGQVCSGGRCALECVGGSTKCVDKCVETASDPKNCGACGKECPGGEVCAAGTCALECVGGSTKCGDKCRDTDDDPTNCGACGKLCPGPMNAAATCVGGMCSYACGPSKADCNGVVGDGCEIDLSSDPLRCGACDAACPAVAHGSPGCASSVCGVGSCNPGFADCDKDAANGCELSTAADDQNCGGCGVTCAADQTCSAGKCAPLLWSSGVQTAVAVGSFVGWTQCFTGDYATSYDLSTVLAKCSAPKLLLACKQSADATYGLVAMGARSDVLFACGTQTNCTKQGNGVGWYFDADFSWGFAPAGDDVNRTSCDSNAGGQADASLRMCWTTGQNAIAAGYRCGDNTISGDATWVREIWQAN